MIAERPCGCITECGCEWFYAEPDSHEPDWCSCDDADCWYSETKDWTGPKCDRS